MKNLITAAKIFLGLCVAAALAGCGGGDGDRTGGDNFNFNTASVDHYVRIDRMGEPALATALLSKTNNSPTPVDGNGNPVNPGATNKFNNFDNQRDAFNRGDPVNDARDFAFILTVGPQINSLANYHYKLGPQLRALGLTPCSTETVTPPANNSQVNISTCVAQVAPVVLPDVITYDPNVAIGWPNGRHFDDPVVDRLLAASLLKISGAGAPHNINTLVGVIDPTKDETGTLSPVAFPHLRPANPFP
jgi:hypothetical protein